MDQLPRLGKRELICLLSFTCNYVVFVWKGFLFLWVLGMGYVILLWHSLSLLYNYFAKLEKVVLALSSKILKELVINSKDFQFSCVCHSGSICLIFCGINEVESKDTEP